MMRNGDAWKRILKAAGLRTVRIHDLRHTNASIAAAAGIPLYFIKERLGHSDISTTMRYTHAYNKPLQQATAIVSGLISGEIEQDIFVGNGMQQGQVIAFPQHR